MGDWIPDARPNWWDDLKRLMTLIRTYGIVGWFRRRAVRFILGGIAGLVFALAGVIRTAWNTLSGALGGAGAVLWNTIGGTIAGFLSPVTGVNTWLFQLTLGNAFGPLEGPVIAMIYVVEFAVVIRLIKPALLGVSEAVGGVPVIGSVVTGAVQFAVEASDSLVGGARRAVGGIV